MEAQQTPVTRRRVITSCSNCHRRKQKCNRRRPCNNCTVRNVGHECFYDTLSWNSNPLASRTSLVVQQKSEGSSDYLPEPISTAREAFGYSAAEESNAFIEASKLVQESSKAATERVVGYSVSLVLQKYWSLISRLPAGNVFDDLIDTYLSEVHWIYGIIEPHYFNRTLQEWRVFTSSASGSTSVEAISAELKSFPAMLFQVMATSLLYLPPKSPIHDSLEIGAMQLSQNYSDAGFEIVQLLGYSGISLNAVQHDLLRSAWLKNRGRGAEAWHSLNSSIRKAQDLNLHRQSTPNFDPSKEQFWFEEWKKRIWTTLYMWDSNMSTLLGRPRLINLSDCNTEPPLDCDIPSNLDGVQLSSIQAYIAQRDKIPSSVCMNRYMYLLSHKINEIRTLGADKRDLKDYSIVQRLHYEILSLLEDLPPAFCPSSIDTSWDLQMPILPRQRDKIYTCAHALLIALHRPHVAKHIESRRRAQEAALNVLDSQQRFFEVINAHHYGYFGNAFFSIDAAIVLSTVVSLYPSHDIEFLHRILLAVQQAMGRLSLLETQNELAPFGLRIIRSCYQMVKDRYEESRRINSTINADWDSPSGAGVEIGNTYQHVDLGGSGYDLSRDFPAFASSSSRQGDLSTQQLGHAGRNEFDTHFWMDYRQLVFDDAVFTSENDVNQELSINGSYNP